MNQQTEPRFNLNIFLAVLFIGAVIAAIVMAALAFDVLWSLIGGVFVVGVIGVALAAVGVALYTRMSASKAQREELLYRHAEAMAKAGLMIDDRRALTYEPMHSDAPQIAAPRQKVYDFNPNDIHTASVNYLLYSINLLGENGNRLASAPECAAATNLENYSARSRDRIVKHLSNAYGVVTQPGPIENGGGTFVPEAFGTVGRLYHHVLLNSAVEALPENKR